MQPLLSDNESKSFLDLSLIMECFIIVSSKCFSSEEKKSREQIIRDLVMRFPLQNGRDRVAESDNTIFVQI